LELALRIHKPLGLKQLFFLIPGVRAIFMQTNGESVAYCFLSARTKYSEAFR
jgi:hypothetical protein